jgi:uncharacterized glyoxalase superfamily protein PhnB
MVRFHSIMPVLRVADLERALGFYRDVLDFRVAWRSSDDGGEHCILELGEARLLLSNGAHLGGTPAFTGTLYFDVEGVDELYIKLKDRAPVVWPLENMDYGQREFGIKDPDGYTLAFAQEIAAA